MKPIFIVPLILIAFIVVGLIVAWQLLQQKPEIKKISQLTPKELVVSEKPSVEQKKIAYVKNNSVWVVNSDGTDKNQLMPDSNRNFPQLSWKNVNAISYIQCETNCQIRTTNIEKINPLIDADPGESVGDTQILTFAWNHAGNQLAYIYKLPDGQMRMDFKSGAVKNVVKTFASLTAGQGGRGGSLDDNVSLYFSPDDKYVLVTNTLGQPTVNDKSTIWVFESNGKEILNIESNTNSWATQARWIGLGNFIYKMGSSLYVRSTNDNNSEQLNFVNFKNNCFNPIPQYDATRGIFCWMNSTTLPTTIGVDSEIKLDGYYKPEKLDEFHLVVLKAQKVPEGQEAMFPYISGGFSKIDLRDKQVTNLDTGDINLFVVSP